MKKKYIILCSVFFVALAIDLITKHFSVGFYSPFIKNVLSFYYVENTGAAFSFFSDNTFILAIVSLFMIAGFVFYDIYAKKTNTLYTISLALILAGAVGNMIDRFALGYVRDFIKFDFWPSFAIFNLADTFLCIGLCLFVLHVFLSEKNIKEI